MSITKNLLFTCLSRSQSQSYEEQESICSNLDLLFSTISHQYLASSTAIGDFNAKCSKSCSTDKNNTMGLKIDRIITKTGQSQMFNKPTEFINESSSCINLIYFQIKFYFLFHKRDSKNLIRNYRPISLLSIFSKIFDKRYI